ncbi:MAG TPA: hypothetical protein VG895_05490 [Patescibacteria group bacterium]|nr:hypothetical protein [Patescibacteria group bacterium]
MESLRLLPDGLSNSDRQQLSIYLCGIVLEKLEKEHMIRKFERQSSDDPNSPHFIVNFREINIPLYATSNERSFWTFINLDSNAVVVQILAGNEIIHPMETFNRIRKKLSYSRINALRDNL